MPNIGYHFVNWSDTSTDNPRTDLGVTGNIGVTANFAINTYTFTYSAGAHGSISGITPQSVNHGLDGSTVTAVPDANYHFVNWSDNSIDNPRTDLNAAGDINVTANLAIDIRTLTYAAGAHGSISGTTPQSVGYGGSGSQVTAVADPNYHFVNWSDDKTDNPRTDTSVTDDLSVIAIFAIDTHTVTFQTDGKPEATLTGAVTQTVEYGGSCSEVTANDSASLAFIRWMCKGQSYSTDNSLTVTNVTEDMILTAEFESVAPYRIFQWTWLKGAKTNDEYGMYGNPGTPADANVPGARTGAVKWTGTDGRLYMMGGYGWDAHGTWGWLNDMWRYDPATNGWTWLKGSDTADQVGIYGIPEVADDANYPSGRSWAASWTGADGKFYLLGGFGLDISQNAGYLNDMWRYDPTANRWTWLKGSNAINQSGIYGAQGSPDDANAPGARYGNSCWTGPDGKLYLCGGYGYDSSGSLYLLSDLWRYDTDANQWTWLKGSQYCGESRINGTKGTPDNANTPGMRLCSFAWTGVDGKLYLFGGGQDETPHLLNDMWRYDPATNQWTWINGPDAADHFGVYGTQGVPEETNISGGRCMGYSWTGADGKLYLFGGRGYDRLSYRGIFE